MIKGFRLKSLGLFRSRKIKDREMRESRNWDSLYRTLSYHFENSDILETAMTHRSFLNDDSERYESNERLEFLGDAVLGMIVTDALYRKYKTCTEGELTRVKSNLVSRENLAKQAAQMELGRYILLGSGEEKSGGRTRKSILSDGFEAMLGAVYLDGGLEAARHVVDKFVLKNMDRLVASKFHHNYKSWLLEHLQGQGEPGPRYRVADESGPDHKKEFTVTVSVRGEVLGEGKGNSKKRAEQEAARQAVERLGLKR